MMKYLLVLALTLTSLSLTTAQNCGTSRRRPWRSLSCAEQETFLRACQDLKASGRWDELVLNHQRSGDWGHLVPAFLLWHRWLVWIGERELQRISGTCLTIPYWDWERPGGIESALSPDTFGSNTGRGCVRDGIARDWRVVETGGCLVRAFDDRWRISRDTEILSRITNNRDFGRFRVALEGAPHTNTHEWVGGAMADRWAVDDPLFWLHHANVDRIYTLWQNYWGHSADELNEMGRPHYDANLNDQLVFRYTRQINWMSPRTGRPPTIRELMKVNGPDAIMSVVYEDDAMAQQLVQTSAQFAQRIDTNWNRPGRVATAPRCQGPVNAGGSPQNPFQGNAAGNNQNQNQNQGRPPQRPPQDQGNSMGFGGNNNNNQQQQQQQCRPRNARCRGNGQCCSRRCRQGRCRSRNNIRALQHEQEPEPSDQELFMDYMQEEEIPQDEPSYLHDTADFGDQQDRWYELMEIYTPQFPELIFEQLAREDCERAQLQLGHELQMVSPEWIQQHHVPANVTQAFQCHSTASWNPMVLEVEQAVASTTNTQQQTTTSTTSSGQDGPEN